jgi:hypothetical protein
VHLVGFIIRIYHDVRSSERQIHKFISVIIIIIFFITPITVLLMVVYLARTLGSAAAVELV